MTRKFVTDFKIGDLVTYGDAKASPGGVIYQVVSDNPPAKVAFRSKKVKKIRSQWDNVKCTWIETEMEITEYGSWDEQWRKMLVAEEFGFLRIRPVYSFFPTNRGKNPVGKNGTIIVSYTESKNLLKKIDLVTVSSKYAELGNVIRDIAKNLGAEGV